MIPSDSVCRIKLVFARLAKIQQGLSGCCCDILSRVDVVSLLSLFIKPVSLVGYCIPYVLQVG